MKVYSLPLVLPKNLSSESYPDIFIFTPGARPPAEFVMSRSIKGQVRSCYGDDNWDFRHYTTPQNGDLNIYFDRQKLKEHVEDVRWLMFLLLHYPGRRRGKYKYNTALGAYKSVMRIASYAVGKDLPILEVFSRKHCLNEIFINSTGHQNKAIRSIIAFFYLIPNEISGFVCVQSSLFTTQRISIESKQTAPVPERILLAAITKLNSIVSDYLEHETQIAELCRRLSENDSYGRCFPTQRKISDSRPVLLHNFEEALYFHGLRDVSVKYQIYSSINLGCFLNVVQFSCKTLIHIFSGMRDKEVFSLRQNCLVRKRYKNFDVLHLLGVTTKLVPGSGEFTYWVTAPEVSRAIMAAESILKIVSREINVPLEELSLFTSTSYLPFTNGRISLESKNPIQGDIDHTHYNNRVFFEDVFKITSDDIEFLQKIDPVRDWDSEPKFQPGSLWKFSTHQFRRSLAIYGLSSGLVSLTSLKRQFKHISLAMTLYYVRGLLAQDKLFGDSPHHFRCEIIMIKPLVEALDYMNLQYTEETLRGSHGTFIERVVKPQGNAAVKISREETISRFRNGEIGYKETPLGGCVSVEPCLKPFYSPLTRCTRCPNQVLIKSKATETARVFEDLIKILPEGPERITEQAELDELLAYIAEIE